MRRRRGLKYHDTHALGLPRGGVPVAQPWNGMQSRSVRISSWCVGTDRLGYPAIGQQERHHPIGIEERTLISRILTDSAGRNIISTARARISAGRRGEGKTPMSLFSSRVGQHSTRYTSYTYSSKHKRNHAAPALLGCRFKHNEGAHPNSWQPCSSSCRIEGGGGSARQYITRPPRKQEER